MINLSAPLNVAARAARKAGDMMLQALRDLDRITVEQKRANDFVTAVDRAAEEIIIDSLARAYPDHLFWGEERGVYSPSGKSFSEADAKKAEYLWLIDPLDGTTNFIHGFPHFAVSIALIVQGKLSDALVFDPNRDEMFIATRGRGAFINQQRLRVSNRERLEDALLATGFIFRDKNSFEKEFARIQLLAAQTVGIRRAGAASLDLAYTAAGRVDGFFEQHLQPWDVAAGALLVQEAGGFVGDFKGQADYLYGKTVLAAPPKLFAALLHKIQG